MLECLRSTEPLLRTYEHSDYSTFGMKNLVFRNYEPSDYRTFGLESSHHYGQFLAMPLEMMHARMFVGNWLILPEL